MKTNSPLLPSLGLALLAIAAASQTQAQTWQTVYNSRTDNLTGLCGDIGADASGNVYAVGRYEAAGESVAIVQGAPANPGTNWDPLDAYSEPNRSYSYHRAFAADLVHGKLFAGGNLNNLLSNGSYEFDTLWFIREWNPVTRTWSTADDYSALANDGVGQSSCADIFVAPSGDVYATGGGQLGTGLGWLIRKRPAGGSAFTPADVDYSGQSAGSGLDMAYHPTLGVIAVGYVNDVWTVRHSTTGTLGSWQTLDSFQTQTRRGWEWRWTTANAVAVSQATNIFVAGSAWNGGTGKYHWVVRQSSDAGATWTISDNAQPTGGVAEALGIATDGQGRVFVCGRSDKGNGYHWLVRRGQLVEKTTTSTKKGKTVTITTYVWEWSDIDDFQLENGRNSRANAIAIDAAGNVFAGGSGLDADEVQRFVVRKLPAQ